MHWYWLSFRRWNHGAGRWFVCERFYRHGYKWTPIIRVEPRRRYLRVV